MKKSVLISIRPEWCNLIAGGRKTAEVRKTRPKLETPFKCYIYCTSVKRLNLENYVQVHRSTNGLVDDWSEQVFGEFTCDYISSTIDPACGLVDVVDCEQSCLTPKEIIKYADGGMLHFWHISNLCIYERPKKLADFDLTRPPQSWGYVKEE